MPDDPSHVKHTGRRIADEQSGFAHDLLRRLIARPSIEENGSAIAGCLDLTHDALAPFAYEIERPVHDGLPALLLRFGAGPAERMLTICGHIDVVSALGDWATPPFTLTERDGCLLGRGVVDMKGGVAAAVAAIRGLADVGLLNECRVELAITGDEEVGSARGVRALLATNAFRGRMVVCPEPTNLDVFLGNRGTVAMEIVVHGRGGHAGLVHALDSPIGPAMRLAQAIESMPLTARDERFDPPAPSIAITRIEAGGPMQESNVVPDSVKLTVDRRVLPAEDLDAIISDIARLIDAKVPLPFRTEWRVIKRWPPCETASDHLVSRAAQAAVQSTGRSGAFAMDLPANDTSWFVEAGIPAILFGPGDPLQAHATDESLDVGEFRDAIAIYAKLLLAAVALPD